jgi:valyl-tRNA synthetase
LAQLINIEEERAKLQAKLEKTEAEIARCENMLKNPNFVSKAPAEKVELEREKLVGFRKQKEEIEKLLNELNK